MNIKTIILVVILAIIIGALIVFVPRFLAQQKQPAAANIPSTKGASAIATPIPTAPPVAIDDKSNLKDEINKIKVPDFKQDFEDLKKELN